MAQAKTNSSTILDPSRRGFLARAAAVAASGAALGMALPLPVSAETPERVPDPILEVIERHRRAYHAWMDGMGEDEIEARVPRERRQSNLIGAIHGDADWQVAGDDPRWIAHIENAVRTGIEHEAAALALVDFETISLSLVPWRCSSMWRASKSKMRRHGRISQTMPASATTGITSF